MPGKILQQTGPSPIYVEQGDVFLLNLTAPWSLIGGSAGSFYITYRMMLNNGQFYENTVVVPYSLSSGAGNPNYISVQAGPDGLPEGWLLAVSLTPQTTTNMQAGSVYVQLFVGKDFYTNTNIVPNYMPYCLIARALPSNFTMNWPGAQSLLGVDGPGCIINIQPANPGAGVQLSYNFVGSFRYQILSINFTLTTSAVAGNRFPQIKIVKNAKTLMTACAGSAQVASVTGIYNFKPSTGAVNSAISATAQEQIVPLESPLFVDCIADGLVNTLSTGIYGLDAGDTITNITIRTLLWNEIS